MLQQKSKCSHIHFLAQPYLHQTDKYPVSLVYSWIGHQTGNKRPRVYSQLQNRLVILNKLFTQVKVLHRIMLTILKICPETSTEKPRTSSCTQRTTANIFLDLATFNILEISKLCAFTIALYKIKKCCFLNHILPNFAKFYMQTKQIIIIM